jgi:hypothetical protein
MSKRSIAVVSLLAGTLVLAAAAVAAQLRPAINSPASASPGDTIHVRASGLRPGTYAVVLYATTAPNRDWACAARLARVKHPVRKLSLDVRIPDHLGCYSGFPASFEQKTAASPGRYKLVVGVPQSSISFYPGKSQIERPLKLR